MNLGSEITIAIIVLAAGRASRMGDSGGYKLLATFDGVPLVRRSVETAIASAATSIVVVTGHRRDEIEAALSSLPVAIVNNADYVSGMASSLVAGASSPAVQSAEGVMILLADMPALTSSDLSQLIAAFRASSGQAIVRAVANGRRGNPVILPRALLPEIAKLTGDVGARQVIENSGLAIVDVDIGDAAHIDVDTPEQVVAAGGRLAD